MQADDKYDDFGTRDEQYFIFAASYGCSKTPGIEFVALDKCDRDILRQVCSSLLEQIKQPIVPSVALCARCITTTARS